MLNSVDITTFTALGATIEESENASHLCDFVYYPAAGVQDSDDLNLKPLQIDVDVGAGWETIFQGEVHRHTWDQKTRAYSIRGSTHIQQYFRNLGDNAAVLAVLPGAVYSDAVFGEPPDDLWEYAQLCMSTIEKDVHLDRSGALVLIDWAAKGTADHVLNGDDVHHEGDFRLDRLDADELINQVIFEYQYRVQRKKIRTHKITWSAWRNSTPVDSWCDWIVGPISGLQFGLPNKSMVEGALTGGSWNIPESIDYSTHRASDAGLCGLGFVWVNPNPGEYDFQVITASATGYRAFTQSIWEKYTITVNANAAQALYGSVISERKQAAKDVELTEEWPPENAYPEDTWSVDVIGDSYEDAEEETERLNDLACVYQWATWRIRGAQRSHALNIRTDLRPDISLADTVSISSYGLTAKGKVTSIKYTLSAAPYATLGVAVSRGAGGSTDPWTVPARPPSAPTHPAPDPQQDLLTHVGNWNEADPIPDPDERLGLITNVVGAGQDGTNPYEPAFRVEWPEVEEDAIAEVEPAAPSTWEISVNHDTLTIT